MEVDGLPEVVPPSGWVPGQLLLAAPILKRRWRRYREDNEKSRLILGVSSSGGKYRRRGAPRGATGQPGGSLARPRVGPRQQPSWLPGGGPPSFLDDSGRFRHADILYIFPGIF